MTNIVAELATGAARDLRVSGMEGRVAVPGDAEYERARQIWNGAVDSRKLVFALCEGREDVQLAIRTARRHKLRLSVRGGAHDFAGRALREKGLVIDLRRMRRWNRTQKHEPQRSEAAPRQKIWPRRLVGRNSWRISDPACLA
jgi:FAD/FMN-containing dehydrogenase